MATLKQLTANTHERKDSSQNGNFELGPPINDWCLWLRYAFALTELFLAIVYVFWQLVLDNTNTHESVSNQLFKKTRPSLWCFFSLAPARKGALQILSRRARYLRWRQTRKTKRKTKWPVLTHVFLFSKPMKVSLHVLLLVLGLACTSSNKANAFTSKATSLLHSQKVSSTQIQLFEIFNEGKKKLVKSLAGEYDEEAIKARILGLIEANPILMLSFTTWPYCIKAKEVLDAKSVKYTVVELDTDPDGKAIRAEMADFIGRTSVPAIWIGGQFVGGCNDGPMGGIVKLNESGELNGLLQGVGAL